MRARGFTLIEMIIVIVVLGIVASAVALFVNNPVRAYFDTQRRAQLSDAADTATRRIARDLQDALPNSVRIANVGSTVFVEFTPISDSGRYRAAASSGNEPAGIDPLDFTDPSDTSFQVLGSAVMVPSGAQLVIFNLGAGSFDVYAGTNRRAVSPPTGSTQTISFVAGAWPGDSPDARFYLVTTPVSYVCKPAAGGTGRIERYSGYAFNATQPTSTGSGALASATRTLLVDGVLDCSFQVTSLLANANGMSMSLALGDTRESVRLYTQVHLTNTP